MDKKIAKIKLNSGQEYTLYDADALHYDEQGRLVTGEALIDTLIVYEGCEITNVKIVAPEINVSDYDYILVQDKNQKIAKRPVAQFLHDDLNAEAGVNDSVLEIKL